MTYMRKQLKYVGLIPDSAFVAIKWLNLYNKVVMIIMIIMIIIITIRITNTNYWVQIYRFCQLKLWKRSTTHLQHGSHNKLNFTQVAKHFYLSHKRYHANTRQHPTQWWCETEVTLFPWETRQPIHDSVEVCLAQLLSKRVPSSNFEGWGIHVY